MVKHKAYGTMNLNICRSGIMRPRKGKEGEGSYACPLNSGREIRCNILLFSGRDVHGYKVPFKYTKCSTCHIIYLVPLQLQHKLYHFLEMPKLQKITFLKEQCVVKENEEYFGIFLFKKLEN
jgi:hypothetical protein